MHTNMPFAPGMNYTASVYIDDASICDAHRETEKKAKLAALEEAQDVIRGWDAMDSSRTLARIAHEVACHQERSQEYANKMAAVLEKWRPLAKESK